ncbi:hypothetical protein FRC00_008081, partial [Tulasnella sp. 408]
QNSEQLESGWYPRRSVDYAYQLTLTSILIIALNLPLGVVVHYRALLHCIVYLSTRLSPDTPVSIFGLINIRAFYSPFALLFLDVVSDGPGAAIVPLTGVLAGHNPAGLDWENRDAAQNYIIDVLDDFFTANTNPQTRKTCKAHDYQGLTEAMDALWRSSCEGDDTLHLSIGAVVHPQGKSNALSGVWTKRPKTTTSTPKPDVEKLFDLATLQAFLRPVSEAGLRQRRGQKRSADTTTPDDVKRRCLNGTTGWTTAKPHDEGGELVGEGQQVDQEGMQVDPEPQRAAGYQETKSGAVAAMQSWEQLDARVSVKFVASRIALRTEGLEQPASLYLGQGGSGFGNLQPISTDKKIQSHGLSIYKWVEKTLNGLRGVKNEIQSDATLEPKKDYSLLEDLLLVLDHGLSVDIM